MSNEDGGFDATDALNLTHLDGEPSRPESGARRIGNYRILQQLGEGGMGVVYEAEQERPVRRRVALKVIKLGMDTARVVARFQSERQALALMNHPNIARVYDAGATDEGRPYFAMECVQGIPINEYCERNHLDTTDRLELFIQVCEGVQHAHQKGIIHRDIKPTNVLVSDQDGYRVPKIIDFGVAKATAQRLTEQTFFTEMGQLIGTPEYMSPEQAEMSGLDIDTRTDVYLLGVLLYELLTGRLPFDASDLRRDGFDAYRRKVLEEEPPKPSTCVSTVGPAGAKGERRVERALLARELRGDLDWITMKALEKDRTRRYGSASELAAEVRRYLDNQPVLAGPPSNLYKIGKFLRRHRAGAVLAAAVLLVLLLGVAATAYANFQVRQARDDEAQQAATARRITDFLISMFEKANPDNTRGENVTARELLEDGERRIRTELSDEPLVRARLMRTMAEAFQGLGMGRQAVDLVQQAYQIQRPLLGDDDLQVAETEFKLAGLLIQTGAFERARTLYEKSLATTRRHVGDDAPEVDAMATSLGSLLASVGESEAAAALFSQVIASREERLGPDDPTLAPSISNQAAFLWRAGDYAGARRGYERALALRIRGEGRESNAYAQSLEQLARLDADEERYDDARARFDEVLAIRNRLYGEAHERVAATQLRVAILERRRGRHEEAARFYRRALDTLGEPDRMTNPYYLYDVACYQALAGERDLAVANLHRAIVDRGYTGAPLSSDRNLAPLRDDPAFAALEAAVKRVIEQRGAHDPLGHEAPEAGG